MAEMTRSRRSRLRSEEGAELVEFALVLPFLLLVVIGIAEFGIILQRYEVITNAAREGARVAVLPGYIDTDVQARVTQYLTNGRVPNTSTNPVVAVTDQTQAITGGPTISLKRVTVTYTYTYMFLPKIGTWFNKTYSTLTLSAVSEMRSEVAVSGS